MTDNYSVYLSRLLRESINEMPSLCLTDKCSDDSHHLYIDNYLATINKCIHDAMYKCIPKKSIDRKRFNCIAGWNDLVGDKHETARRAFLDWVMAGKPRTGWIFDLMRRSRSQFKLALRSYKRNEEQFKAYALARDLLSNNSNEFWRKVKQVSCSKIALSNVVGEATNVPNIAEIWKQHFKALYNQHNNKDLFDDVYAKYQNDNNFIISVDDLRTAVHKLRCGKSVGEDGIAAEALIYGGDLLFAHLTILFNMCIAHRYLPSRLMATTIIPVV